MKYLLAGLEKGKEINFHIVGKQAFSKVWYKDGQAFVQGDSTHPG